MKIFDFNIHLPDYFQRSDIDSAVASEKTSLVSDLILRIKNLPDTKGGNIMVFNENFKEHKKLREVLSSKFENFSITQLVDINRCTYNYKDIDCIKFHSYHQNITIKDYSRVLKLCKQASSEGKIICLDASYGGSKMHKNIPMELACEIASEIKDTPIVLLHSGGLKCMEALLLADAQENIMLDTSFTLEYYWGSPLIQDLEFIYKKIGSKKILFGSDSPYCCLENQIKYMQILCDKIFPDKEDQDNIFLYNALALINN